MAKKFFLCYFETTRKCNLACPYCMTGGVSPEDSDELSTEEAKSLVLDEVHKYTPKAGIAFSGGEFLMRDDALDLLNHNSNNGLWSFINTNGELLDDALVAEIKKATNDRITFVLSLDSVADKKEKTVRDGSLARIEEKTAILEGQDAPYFFVVTISKSNLNELGDVFAYATRHNRPVLRSPLVPRGRGVNHKDLMFDTADMRDIIHPVLRQTWLSYISFVPFFAAPKFFQKHWLKASIAIKQLGCQAGKGYIGISPEGDVAPCVHLLDSDAVCSNVRETPLSETLMHNELLTKLRSRKELKGKCGICKYRDVCGGCRARAYYASGDVLGEDPTCFFDPGDPASVADIEKLQNENVGKFAHFISTVSPWKDIF